MHLYLHHVMKRCLHLFALFALLVGTRAPSAQAQSSAPDAWRWLPAERVMPRLLANPLEPATGVYKTLGRPLVEARIGAAWDVVRWEGRRAVWGFDRAAFGLDAFAIMQLDIQRYGSKSPLSFPFGSRKLVNFELETGDYAFGGYLVGEQHYGRVTARYRLHVIHISAHLGDGRYLSGEQAWVDDRAPIYYSRNYGQLTGDFSLPNGIRVYGGLSYITFHSPVGRAVSPWFVSGGIEYRWPRRTLLKPFVAVDLRTFDAERAAGGPVGYQLVAGVRLGQWQGRGLNLVVTHYDGPSWRGQFFDLPISDWHAGFTLDVQ